MEGEQALGLTGDCMAPAPGWALGGPIHNSLGLTNSSGLSQAGRDMKAHHTGPSTAR